MTDDIKSAAQAILSIPLFNAIMDELETREVNGAINAHYDDHEKRQAHLLAVKAIRNLRLQIGNLAQVQPSSGRKAPA